MAIYENEENMNSRIIHDISNFVFVQDTLQKADIIFIPGSFYKKLAEEAALLWKAGYASLIVPSGRYSIVRGKPFSMGDRQYQTECEFLSDILKTNGVEQNVILGEDKASFTQQNARYSKKLLEGKKIEIKKAIICCKSFHARRCLMYYQFAFPDVEFIMYPVTYCEDGIEITKDNWYQTEKGLDIVLGELRRYGEQFKEEFLSIL